MKKIVVVVDSNRKEIFSGDDYSLLIQKGMTGLTLSIMKNEAPVAMFMNWEFYRIVDE